MPMNQHEHDLETIRQLRLMDDDFMCKVFEDSPECVAYVLNVILEREDIEVISVRTQYAIHSL